MKLYKINKDGFNVGIARGKKKAIEYLKSTLAWEGIINAKWGKFITGVLRVDTGRNQFTIEES